MSKKLICFVEGKSDEKFLEFLVEKIKKKHQKKTEVECLRFSGYPGLKNNFAKFLKRYDIDDVFLILVDKDNVDCRTRKREIFQEIRAANNKKTIKIRVACHNLESFYLGDPRAIKNGLKIPNEIFQLSYANSINNPDYIKNPREELKKISGKYGNKKKGLLAEAITPYLKIDGTNKSDSFNVLVTAIEYLL